MTEISASPGRVLNIGYEGEDNVTLIKFRYDSEWLLHGAGEFKIRVLRHGDTEAYSATEVVDDRESMTLTMTVTDIELSVKGHGEMQVVYVGSDFVKKSPVYRYNVSRAIDSEVVNPPQGSVINELVQSVGDLTELTTTDKSSLVSAINEVNQQGGGSITVDDELSGISENPVQNKVIMAAFMEAFQRLTQDEIQIGYNSDTISGLISSISDVQIALAGKASTDVVTQSANGLMSSADKTKLDGLGIYQEKWELIRDYIPVESVNRIDITTDERNESFALVKALILCQYKATETTTNNNEVVVDMKGGNAQIAAINNCNSANANGDCIINVDCSTGMELCEITYTTVPTIITGSLASGAFTNRKIINTDVSEMSSFMIRLGNSSYKFDASSTRVRIYGVRV